MAGLSNLIVLLLCISLGFILMFPQAGVTSKTTTDIKNVSKSIDASRANLTILGVNFGTVAFPNPFSIFSGLASLFGSIGNLIGDIGTGLISLPAQIQLFFAAIFLVLFALYSVDWLRGVRGT